MKSHANLIVIPAILLIATPQGMSDEGREPSPYRWPHADPKRGDTIGERFTPPAGYKRVAAAKGSFGNWLRGLPLLPETGVVHQHDGKPKDDQQSHAAVMDIDVGQRDLQQCADAVIRLRAEYQFTIGDIDNIQFKFTSGDVAKYKDWRRGMRPTVKGKRVAWSAAAREDTTYSGFRKYLDTVFTYAGTMSLSKEMSAVNKPTVVQIGDVFVDPGSPGHAVIVVDVIEHERTRHRMLFLAQSFMPAQQIHVLHRASGPSRAWFELSDDGELSTPHWRFRTEHLRRFKPTDHELPKQATRRFNEKEVIWRLQANRATNQSAPLA